MEIFESLVRYFIHMSPQIQLDLVGIRGNAEVSIHYVCTFFFDIPTVKRKNPGDVSLTTRMTRGFG